ncbi:hypothetical protein [Flavobacterium sp. LB3R33]|uniref:hypothetical protein n=1 Tax=Flavobacterium sp. LB3R33 TaxID=3401721 RepID=UPI003AAC2B38
MKSNNKNKFLLVSLKRDRKLLTRKRKDKKHINDNFTSVQRFRVNYETKVVTNFKSKLFQFLIENRFINGGEEVLGQISIPHMFCLEEYYNETVEIIGQIIVSIWHNIGKSIIIDFSKCDYVGQSALFLLQILRLELQSDFNDLNNRLSVLNSKIDIKILKSKNITVNLNLLLCGYMTVEDEFELEEGVTPINTLGYLKGKKQQKSYLENKKGVNATKIVEYINECLIRNSFELSETGVNDITGMIGEILSNAEDHSPFSTYYVTANYTQILDNKNDENVGLLNLSFLNFGYSIYEGLLETKNDNSELFDELQNGCKILKMKAPFTDENLFTLFALQDGVSRLKYKDESRGTGTMKFINCFFSFGDYQNTNKQQSPRLSILSGNTQLICDNKYKPFLDDNKFYVSLNDDNDLSLPPNKSHLKDLRYKFPGTLLSVRAFLNKDHISNKISNNE